MQGTRTIVGCSTGALFSFTTAAIRKHAGMCDDDAFGHSPHGPNIWSILCASAWFLLHPLCPVRSIQMQVINCQRTERGQPLYTHHTIGYQRTSVHFNHNPAYVPFELLWATLWNVEYGHGAFDNYNRTFRYGNGIMDMAFSVPEGRQHPLACPIGY
jgi:hypothetical protein